MFDKETYDMGYASMYSDNSTCDINIMANVKGGWMSVTQNLNYSYNEETEKWNCEAHTRRGNVRLFVSKVSLFPFQFISYLIEHC
jgi:hypothetical protein